MHHNHGAHLCEFAGLTENNFFRKVPLSNLSFLFFLHKQAMFESTMFWANEDEQHKASWSHNCLAKDNKTRKKSLDLVNKKESNKITTDNLATLCIIQN